MVGDAVGSLDGKYDPLGLSLGEDVGLLDGESDGLSVGPPVGLVDGLSDGLLVGEFDGLFVGLLDGEFDGLSVGPAEGLGVGLSEGDDVGLFEGEVVGLLDGELDGLLVGSSVHSAASSHGITIRHEHDSRIGSASGSHGLRTSLDPHMIASVMTTSMTANQGSSSDSW